MLREILREMLRTLLKAGAALSTHLNHSALMGHIATMFYNGNDLKEVCLLLLAAGEKLDATTQFLIPDYLLFKDMQLNLKHLCREALRNHLLKLDPHTYLFDRVPRLGLPPLAMITVRLVTILMSSVNKGNTKDKCVARKESSI